jgi:hypothetical protein
MCLQFGFVFFWRKDFGAKAAHKMLVKLTPVSNSIPQIPGKKYSHSSEENEVLSI